MSVIEILEGLESLPRSDKLLVLQRLAADLARDAGVTALEPDANYPVWAPHNAFEAADTLLQALQADASTEDG